MQTILPGILLTTPVSNRYRMEHAYQFDLSLAKSREALKRMRTFLYSLIEPATLSR
jgi:hypothetical protein